MPKQELSPTPDMPVYETSWPLAIVTRGFRQRFINDLPIWKQILAAAADVEPTSPLYSEAQLAITEGIWPLATESATALYVDLTNGQLLAADQPGDPTRFHIATNEAVMAFTASQPEVQPLTILHSLHLKPLD